MADTDQAVEEKTEQAADGQADSKTKVQTVDLPEAKESASAAPGGSIDILLDMDVPVTVVIGKTQIPVRTLLQLGPGSVLKLDQPIDQPAELFLRDTKFATGTIVVVEDKFAVRIDEIISFAGTKEKN
ncbi:MAG: FliM/FliN family flagellar motor switch protein [Phycisphaerae bacterium]|jgi:flagellar motor switch protein FliN/FliY